MSNVDKISNWISKQITLGKTDDELNGKVFYDGNDSYVIKKTRKSGVFDMKCTFGGAVDLNTI
ncbi:hypothetical protein [Paenibacillus tianjinensis]|uniref:Uncharacterized protein n=1 Tax=Paenibacillus tianjinensis TaxID=2810347 RepID=A0ABX7L676_9BACL|nr:hypothetical protein [Paenibacillus tianjinensis]QSF43417.1 hypothetical protein JRJ22_19325 [Paenibacillus tianjinensis]